MIFTIILIHVTTLIITIIITIFITIIITITIIIIRRLSEAAAQFQGQLTLEQLGAVLKVFIIIIIIITVIIVAVVVIVFIVFIDKPARLIIRLLFGFASDSETSAATP